MKNDEDIKNDWLRLEKENIDKACALLSQYQTNIEDYMADIVASLCNIDVKDMLTDSSVAYLAQARWLYWYAIRYMTNETYAKIAYRTEAKSGYSFTPNGIGQSINKMATLIVQDPMWIKRWTIIKRIIKLRQSALIADNREGTVKVVVPKGIKVEIKND